MLWAKSTQTTPPPSFEAFTGKVAGERVRLRLAPNLEGHVIKELSTGDIFAITAENNEYYAVKPSKDIKAYIFRTHVLDNKIEGERVNIRLQPNLESPILTQLNSGNKVHVHASEKGSKWFEIDMPEDVTFWVAKDYIQKVGPVEYAEKYQERLVEANQMLATATLISQAEFRKQFQEIDLKRVTKNFEKIITDFNDIESATNQAKTAIQNLQKNYCNQKIAFLENQAGQAALEVKTLNAKLTDLNPKESVFKSDEGLQDPFKSIALPDTITDKMKIWQPLEYAQFQAWGLNQATAEVSLQEFYKDELLNAKTLEGIIEPFNKIVKHKPGDYTITLDDQTTAYIYSTHVNLNDFSGKKVAVKVTPRNNNNFAFPAYYVLEVQD